MCRGLFFLTLGRRVVVWTGNRSQRRGSQERMENGTKIDSKRDSNESIRSKGNATMVSHPPTPTTPLSPSSELPCFYSRNSELQFPIGSFSHTCPSFADLTPSDTLEIPEPISQAEPQETKSSKQLVEKVSRDQAFCKQLLALQPRARGPAHPSLLRTFPGQPLPSSARLHRGLPTHAM